MSALRIELDGKRAGKAAIWWALKPGVSARITANIVATKDISQPIGLSASEGGLFIEQPGPSFVPVPVAPASIEIASNLAGGGVVSVQLVFTTPNTFLWRTKNLELYAVVGGGI